MLKVLYQVSIINCFLSIKDFCLRLSLKIVYIILVFFAIFLTIPTSVHAATLYVNADSNGAASNPNRAFNNPSYTPNDSYQTLTAAHTVAISGDTIELSGGVSGKTYPGRTTALSRTNLTVRGSSIAGFNGKVTIDYNSGGSSGFTVGLSGSGETLSNLNIVTTSAPSAKSALAISAANAVITNVTISDETDNYTSDGRASVELQSGGTNATFTNVKIDNYGNSGKGILAGVTGGTTTFNNCVINGSSNFVVNFTAASTINFVNCSITANGTITPNTFFGGVAGGVINTTNTFIESNSPQALTQGGANAPTWNSTNDIVNGFPYYPRTKANMGYMTFFTDDLYNIDYFTTNANYAMNTYGIPLTFYVDEFTAQIDSTYTAKLQALCKAGHEIGAHTTDHTDLQYVEGITVTYSGANANMAFVVSGNGTTLNVTGTSDTHGPIDLTNSSFNTLSKLVTLINTWSNFSAVKRNVNVQDTVPSIDLKDASTSLPISTAKNIPFDDNVGPSNRYYSHEITSNINDIESALHGEPACATYTVKTLAFPQNEASATVLTWIKANTNIVSVRSNTITGNLPDKIWLGHFDLYNAYTDFVYTNAQGSGYGALTDPQKQSRMQQAARAMVVEASNGFYTGMLNHNAASGLSNQDFAWLLDELVKYTSQYNITVSTLVHNANQIQTSGSWTNSSGTFWDRTFSGNDDVSLSYNSPMINAGTAVSGRTTDLIGNSLVGAPDIGAYEFQLPSSASSLSQFKSDGVTSIASGATTGEATVVLKMSMSSVNSYDSLTPQVEIQPIGTAFTNSLTNSGNAVAYSGSPVTGAVTISGLTSGTAYHWQSRISNAVGQSAWLSMGGNPDFSIQISTPVVGSSSNNTSPSTPPSGCNASVGPGTPNLFEIRTNKNSATLFFAPPIMPYSNFYIAYSKNQNTWNYGTQYSQGYSGGVLRYTINHLQPLTTYYFKIRSGNECATGAWSNIMSASTSSSINLNTFLESIAVNILQLPKIGLTIPPVLTTTPSQVYKQLLPFASVKPKPVPKRRFCILWWCF